MRSQMKDIEGQTSSRGRTILKIVIEDFVRTAHPVASKRLKDKYNNLLPYLVYLYLAQY